MPLFPQRNGDRCCVFIIKNNTHQPTYYILIVIIRHRKGFRLLIKILRRENHGSSTGTKTKERSYCGKAKMSELLELIKTMGVKKKIQWLSFNEGLWGMHGESFHILMRDEHAHTSVILLHQNLHPGCTSVCTRYLHFKGGPWEPALHIYM